jgi:glycosyltransferase involved in cell wall biosynthesis
MLRLALDGTPLLGPRSGVGEVVSGILPELARRADVEVVAYALTLRGRNDLAAAVPPGVHAAARWFPARGVRQAWLRVEYPRVERWTGPIDVVHATNYVAPPTKAGEVVSVYDLGFIRAPAHVNADALDYPPLLRRAVRRGAWFHTTSDFVRDEVIETFGVPAERVVRVYPGIPPIEGGDAARGRELAGADRYVMAIGTIEPRKNFPGLVRAFDALAADDPALVLVVAGGRGWGSDAFDAALAAARHADRVRAPGYVSGADRRDLLAGASVLAYPSHYEGFGIPPLEAMVVGVPVVATRAGAVPEVVGDAALLVDDPDDIDALADALQRVLTDDDLRRDLIGRGHARHREFSWTQAVDELVDLYEAVRA